MKGRGEVPTVFLRKATGLVRQIGLFTAILITLCFTVGLGWQRRVFQYSAIPVPENQYVLGINPMVMAFTLIGIVVLLAVFTFGMVTAAMPRAGGGYVVVSRVLHPYLGYVGTWFWFMATALSLGLIGTAVIVVPALVFPNLLGLDNNILATAAAPGELVNAQLILFGLGAFVVIAFSIIALFGVRLTGLLLQILFVIPAVLTIVTYFLLASADAGAMSRGMQSQWRTDPTTFTAWVANQGQMRSNLAPDYWTAVGTATLGAYWAYEGYAATTFVAGEVKEANRNLPRSLFIAGSVIVLVYVSSSALLYRATSLVGGLTTPEGDFSFFSAWAYSSYGPNIDCPATGDVARARACFNATFNAGVLPAWMPLAGALQAEGAGLAFFIPLLGIFAVFWVMNDIPPFILTASRSLFAMSFDRTLPTKFSDVSERWHSPTWAILLTMIVGVIGAMFEAEIDYGRIAAYNTSLGAVFNTGVAATDIWDVTFFSLFSLAAALLPFMRKDIWDRAPYKPRIGPLPVISITGFAAFIGHLWMGYAMLSSPSGYGLPGALSTFDTATPFVLTMVLFVIFTLLYVGYTSAGRAKGADFRTIYTEIPPE